MLATISYSKGNTMIYYDLLWLTDYDKINNKQKNKKIEFKEKFGNFKKQIKDLKRSNINTLKIFNNKN